MLPKLLVLKCHGDCVQKNNQTIYLQRLAGHVWAGCVCSTTNLDAAMHENNKYCINQKKTSLNQNNVGRIPIYQHPPSLSKTPATKMFETPRFPPKYPNKNFMKINHLKQINQHWRSSSHFLHTTHWIRTKIPWSVHWTSKSPVSLRLR